MTPCILTVHAHPDDESSKGAATIARYHDAGVRTVLVCCTGGEEGEILNPLMDRPGVREQIAEIRRQELAAAAEIIGYDEVVSLGYRDSGMPGAPANAHPDCLAMAPLEEAVERLIAVIRRVRPQVIVGYPEDQSGYPHPDHLRAHELARRAFEATSEPLKLYYTLWPARRMRMIHEKLLELGMESPFGEDFLQRLERHREQRITTEIDTAGFDEVARKALLAHATQVDPNHPLWFSLPDDVRRSVEGTEYYQLASSRVGDPVGVERDFFEGILPFSPLERARAGVGTQQG